MIEQLVFDCQSRRSRSQGGRSQDQADPAAVRFKS